MRAICVDFSAALAAKSIRQYASACVYALATLLAACGAGGDSSPSAVSSNSPAPAPGASNGGSAQSVTDKGIVSGKVVDAGGVVVPSAVLSLDGQTVTANAQGFFVLEGAAPGANKSLKTTLGGYVDGVTPVTVKAGQQSFVNVTLKKVGVTRTGLSAATPNTVTDARSDGKNGSVSIPSNAVVDASGRLVNSYTVEISTLQPNDVGFTAMFPGRFLGGSTPGSTSNPQPLISYGVVNVELKDAQGNKLKLAPGARATLSFPIPSNDPGKASIPLWSLDTESGVWVQEGTATRSGSSYVASVTHFSPWNCDIPLESSSIKEVHVRGLNGVGVSDALVIVDGTGYRQIANTGPDGVALVIVSPSDTIKVTVTKGTLVSNTITETAAPVGQRKINFIDLIEPQFTVTLTWDKDPQDLDARLRGPNGNISFVNPGRTIGSPYAALDTDDVNGFGPEIMTVSQLFTGTYRYMVHNFGPSPTQVIGQSKAVVNLVVSKTGLIRRYTVPPSTASNVNLWTVFEIDVDGSGNPTVRDVNSLSLSSTVGNDL